jgi:hypothetical protein
MVVVLVEDPLLLYSIGAFPLDACLAIVFPVDSYSKEGLAGPLLVQASLCPLRLKTDWNSTRASICLATTTVSTNCCHPSQEEEQEVGLVRCS